MVDARQERGRILARDGRIKHVVGSTWLVPSQTQSAGGYLVDVSAAKCSCADFELRGGKCKHQHAVEHHIQAEASANDHDVVGETVKVNRKTYSQDWSAYNAAQCAEKAIVQTLLRALCAGIATPAHPGRGPKPIPLSDAVYGMAMKVYTTASGRRATTDVEACAQAGHMARAPRYNTTFDYFAKPELTALLTMLVEESAAPLACVESKFAADSTGFGTVTYRRWYDQKYGREMKEHGWVKAHAMVGTHTNVITAIRVTDFATNDCPELPPLVASTARRFTMTEVSADKAYLSGKNLEAIEAVHAVPYIPFKSNNQGEGPAAWRRMWGYFVYRQEEFLAHYHARSNVEATFSAMKQKFGAFVRSKGAIAQVNEVLCKALCFNLSCLVHAMFELGLEASFPGLAVPS
jgi:transposase